jgi:hypothetical protein
MAQPVESAQRPQRVVAVLGMHRSGTSALTGSLQKQGLFLGRVSTQNVHNPKGNREATEVRVLNEDVLRASGGSWDRPPAAVAWEPQHEERARGILAHHAAHEVWGFKDPRTLLTLGGWRELVPDLERVGVFRHPGDVARSLERRNAMPADDAVALWRAYNQVLLQEHRRKAFPLLCFDEEPAAVREKLLAIGRTLRLEGGPGEERFFAPELRGAEPHATLPAAARELYDELRTLAF